MRFGLSDRATPRRRRPSKLTVDVFSIIEYHAGLIDLAAATTIVSCTCLCRDICVYYTLRILRDTDSPVTTSARSQNHYNNISNAYVIRVHLNVYIVYK